MKRRSSLAVLAATAALAAAGSAHAAAPWSQPVTVWADPATTGFNAQVGFDTDGRGLFSWTLNDNPVNHSRLTALRSVAPDQSLERQRFATDAIIGRPVFFGARRVAVLKTRARSGGRQVLSVQFASTRDAGSGPTRKIDTDAGVGRAAIAGNRRGLIAVLYSEQRPGPDALWLARRRPKGSFGAPVAIRRGSSFGNIAVAVGAGGTLVVAYDRAGRAEVRVQRPGRALARAQDIGSAAGLQSLQAAVAQNGQAVAALQLARPAGPEQEIAIVRAAVLRAGRGRFRRAGALAAVRGEPGRNAPVGAVIDAAGRATVGWTAAGQGVVTARTDRQGRFGSPRVVAADGVFADLALDDDGTGVVVWRRAVAGTTRSSDVFAALISRIGSTGLPELVSAAEEGAAAPVAAFDPRRARPTVAWLTDEADGFGATLRFATRG